MDAVNQINVGMAGQAKHGFGARGQTFCGMGSEVVGAEIRLDLDNFPDALPGSGPVDDPFSKQFLRDERGVTVVKTAGNSLHSGSVTQFPV